MAFIVIIVFTLIITIIIVGSINGAKKLEQKQSQLLELKANYEQELQGADKKAALDAGRAYYGALRNGPLTLYDEQAIANDLNAMQ